MGDTFFRLNLEGHEFDLQLIAPDRPMGEEMLAAAARLLAGTWNRRHDARHCRGHEWGEEFTMNEDVFGPGVTNAICSLCHVTRLDWCTQQVEESAAQREP